MIAQGHAALRRLPAESLSDLLARLQTSAEGLGTDEAARRLRSFGPNQLQITHLRSEVAELVRASANPLVIILLIAGVASAFLGEVIQAALIAAIVLLSAGINVWQTFRSQRAVARLQHQIAPTATVHRERAWMELPRAISWSETSFASRPAIWFPPMRV
jgi:P-type Mg2+ transporter